VDSLATVVIALVVAVVAPAVLAILTNRHRRAERAEDYKRQDAVADRLAKRQDEVADRLAKRQNEVADQAAEAARLLLESNHRVAFQAAEASNITQGQLRQIHTLVNNNLDEVLRAQLVALQRVAELTEEVTAIKSAANMAPDPKAGAVLAALYRQIGDLKAQIRERVDKTAVGESQVSTGVPQHSE
jgi:hypothetical protein